MCPTGYVCDGSSRQELPCGSIVVFHTFKEKRGFGSCAAALPLIRGGAGASRGSKKVVIIQYLSR